MSVIAPSRRILGLFAVAILASGIAAADTIEVTGTDLGVSHLYIGEDPTDDGTVTATDAYFAGVIDIALTYTTGGTEYDRTTRCVQLFTDINESTYSTTIALPNNATAVAPSTNADLEQIAWLLDNETLTTNDAAAGLQLAIWKIAEDGVYTGASNPFNSGRVTSVSQTDATVLSDAEGYLSDAESNGVAKYSNVAFVYENVTTGNNPTAVQMLEGPEYATGPGSPECSTFVLAGAALLALSRTARRKLGSR